MKSDRQAERIALCWAAVGVLGGGGAATAGFATGRLAVALGWTGGGGAATAAGAAGRGTVA
jgi:hypothetical protein